MLSSIRKSKTAKKLIGLIPPLIIASGIYFSDIKSAHANDANVETNTNETNVDDETEQKNELMEIFKERRDFEFELGLWNNDLSANPPPYHIYDYTLREGKPDNFTQEYIDKIETVAEYTHFQALSKTVAKIPLYEKIKQIIKGVSSVEVEKIKGEKPEVKPPSPDREINPLDEEIEETESDIKKLRSAGLFSQAEQKEEELKKLKLKRKLDFKLNAGVGITNPPRKFNELLKIDEFGYELYGKGKYEDIESRLSVYPVENKTGLKVEKKFLEEKIKVLGEHSYTWENDQQISEIGLVLKVNPTLNFKTDTEFDWDNNSTKYSFECTKELGRRKQLSFEVSYDNEESDFSYLLKFKWMQF